MTRSFYQQWFVVLLAGCATTAVPDGGIFIDVAGLPDGARAPVAVAHDFGAPVDERTIRLHRGDVEVPVQYVPSPQARGGAATSGTLHWRASNGRYRLAFDVPGGGRRVQVPYPPYNFRHFDAQGRATPPRQPDRMRISPQWPLEGKLGVFDGEKPFATYHVSGGRRPFLYPVIGPDGVALTEFGKTHDATGSHAHHYSLWTAHALVDGKDFWSEKGGAIVHEAIEGLEDGPLFARIRVRNRWTETLVERRTLTFYAFDDHRLIEVELEFTGTATLGKTTFGPLAARVRPSMSVFDGGGEIRNAEGALNEKDVHLRRAAWIDLSGPAAPGVRGGVAILDHPSNPGHPTAWHCRDDGWAGAALCKDGEIAITPDKPLRLKYRVVLHRGVDVAPHFAAYAAVPDIRLAHRP
jgi:hypothetical protein